MAICRADYEIFKRIEADGLLPAEPMLLEIGEAEFYGDVPFHEFLADIKARGNRQAFIAASQLLARIRRGDFDGVCWALAKIVYEIFFGATDITSIDLHGSKNAIKFDLNEPSQWSKPHDIVFNTGTAEHVFHLGRVFESIHDWTRPGGLMVHCFPFTGLVDHGFYSVQPTFIYDLSRYNDYEIVYLTISNHSGYFEWLHPRTGIKDLHDQFKAGTLQTNCWLHVCYRKAEDVPFIVPRQGFYDEAINPEMKQDWLAIR